jgi:MFS transporter, DHA2 family, multidrug resistance protein
MAEGATEGESQKKAKKAAANQAYADNVAKFRWWILAGLITAAIMEVLDTTIVNVALPTMAGNLGATSQEIGWVATGYILSNVVVLPMTAFLSARFGRKNYLIFSIILFIVSSFFCGTSHSLVELVFWRIMQGAGGAALLSTAQATLRQIFPPEEQGLVQSVFIMGIIVAPTLGPTLGGYISDNYSWNWCFFINIPIGIASVFLVSTFLHDPPGMRRANAKVDWWGIGLLATGLGCLQYVLEQGSELDWFQSAAIVRMTVVSIVSLSLMVWWELSPKNLHPVVDFHVLKNKTLSATIFLFVALGFGLYGVTFLFPLFTQNILGFTPTETGLSLMPGGLATAASAIMCGRILSGPKPLVDPRVLIFIGMGIFIFAMYTLSGMSPQSGQGDTSTALMIRGFGMGMLFTPINQVAYASLKPQEAQQASGLINLARQLGGSFGIAILGVYVTNHTNFHRADLVSNLYPSNPALIQRTGMLVHALVARGLPPSLAPKAAYAILNGTVNAQAMTISYDDAFKLILVSFFVVMPAILILKKPKGPAGMPAEAH